MATNNQRIECTLCSNIMSPQAASQWEQIDVDMFMCPKCCQATMEKPLNPEEANKEFYEQEDSQRANDYYGSHYQNAVKAYNDTNGKK